MMTEKGYDEKLIKEVTRLQIDKICLLAGHPEVLAWGSAMAPNELVIRAYEKYPEIVIPFGFLDLGMDSPSLVDELHRAGFKGIKFTRAHKNYDDKSLWPVYEKMEKHGMVALFHTGTVLRTPVDKQHDINCNRLRPIYLDPIARAFPDLHIIGAHLGNPWYDEAAMTLFWNPNIYFDLSGTLLKRKKGPWFRETLWWFPEVMNRLAPDKEITHFENKEESAHPFDRIVFGTDVPIPEMEQAKLEHEQILADLNVPESVCQRVWGNNLASMLNI
jgi:predicted TIM-barrel fold metal-dependent hydrolase